MYLSYIIGCVTCRCQAYAASSVSYQNTTRNIPMSNKDNNKNTSKQDTLFVTSLERGLRVLLAFDEEDSELGLAELARKTGMDKSATQRFSNTLHKIGFLQKDATTKRYRPSIKMLEMAYGYLWSDTLVQMAMPKLIELEKAINVTVNMSILDGTDIVYVTRIPGRQANFAANIIGRRLPALNTTSGRVIISAMDKAQREYCTQHWPIKKYTSHTTLDRAVLLNEVELAHRQGYAQANSEIILNEAAIAAPIISSEGRALAAVQCSVSSFTYSSEIIEAEILPSLVETANSLQPANLR